MQKEKILLWVFVWCMGIHSACTQEKEPVRDSNRLVVAQDGSGDYKTLQEAINATQIVPGERSTIVLKPGTYKEKIEILSSKPRISLIGVNAETTIITFDDYSGKGDITTFTSWTFKVMGNDFYAENITFENSAGPVGQAVAIFLDADRAVFKNCRFMGNQDTMYTGGNEGRQYFKDCYIEGTTDFIFGPATAVFEDCHIHSKKNSYVTAASTPEGKSYGYVLINCAITAAPEIGKVYLGRPWRNFAKTVYINCDLGMHIVPEGWHNWSKPEAEKMAFYAEYKSVGAGANPDKRVTWSHQLTDGEVKNYSVGKILAGSDQWNPELQ